MLDGLPQIGAVVAEKYRIERLVGSGGMGSVYAATHQLTGKTVALKCLLPRYAADPAAVARFQREARAIGSIQHRHVIDVFDVVQDGHQWFIVMPLVEGLTLTTLLESGNLQRDQTLRIMVRVMEGVAAAHALGVIHRDLKPCNILVCRGFDTNYDDPRVLDFGISKLAGDDSVRLTQSGATLGTPNYMAIEQLTGRRDVDGRGDIYAVGVMLYEALTGKLPHVGANAAALAVARLSNPPADLALLRPELPPGLGQVVMRALQDDRDLRYATMDEFIAALVPFVDMVGYASAASSLRDRTGVVTALDGISQQPHPSADTLPVTPVERMPSGAPSVLRASTRPRDTRRLRGPTLLVLLSVAALVVWSVWGRGPSSASERVSRIGAPRQSERPPVARDVGVQPGSKPAERASAPAERAPASDADLEPGSAAQATGAATSASAADAASDVRTPRVSGRPRIGAVRRTDSQDHKGDDAGAALVLPILPDRPVQRGPAEPLTPNALRRQDF